LAFGAGNGMISNLKRHKTLVALALLAAVLLVILLLSDPTVGSKFKYKMF
jgi:hypothetical protein